MPCDAGEIDDFLSCPTPGAREVMRQFAGDVLVLGAGGKMGPHLCRMLKLGLAGTGKNVYAVSRFSNPQVAKHFEGIRMIPCDLLAPGAMTNLPDCAHVFYLAGHKFGTSSAPEQAWMHNVVLPAYAAERYKHSRLVVFSTGCVYPFMPISGRGAREDEPLKGPGEYAQTCIGRERVFSHYSKTQGTAVTLFRLNYSVEFHYGVLLDLAKKVLASQPIDVTTGCVNVIWQRDAVARAIQSMALAASPARPINVTGAESLRVRWLAEKFGEALGKPVNFIGAEAETAWLSDASESVRLWGQPETRIEDMIAWTAAWLLQGGDTYNKPTSFDSRDGKF